MRASGVVKRQFTGRGLALRACFPSRHLAGDRVEIGTASIQTLPAQDAQFDLGHIQPTPVFGGVMNLQAVDQRPCHGRLERLIQGRRFVGVEVIDHQDHFLRMGVTDLQEIPDHLGKVHGRPLLGHGHMPLPQQGFVDHEQVGGTTPLVFVVEAGRLAGFDR